MTGPTWPFSWSTPIRLKIRTMQPRFEFMVGDKKAHFAHGQPMAQVEGGPVNIWYWKNKDSKGVDMNAKGFGTLKVQTHQDVKAKGGIRQRHMESGLYAAARHRTSG